MINDGLKIKIEYLEYFISMFLENVQNETEYLKSYRIEHIVGDLDYHDWIIVELEVDEPLYIMEKLLGETVDLKLRLHELVPLIYYRIRMIINGEEV